MTTEGAQAFASRDNGKTWVVNAEAIASVEGVDILFVGPADLRLELSTQNESRQLDFDEALRRVVEAGVKKNGFGHERILC